MQAASLPQAVQAGPPVLEVLPPLRQELAIHPGPEDASGAPTWSLHDPVDNRFFELSWPAFEILSRWQLGRASAVLAAVGSETTLHIEQAEVEGVCHFLARHHLLVARHADDSARLGRASAARQMSHTMWLLKHYLFFRIPLVRPMPFLRAMLPRVEWLFSANFWRLMLVVALLGLYLVSQQWDAFLHTFSAYSGWQGVLGVGVALSVAKVAHELGHAFTAYRHGCRVPQMGVAFMVMVPMLYTDTNEAWKLPSRRARLQIGAAGMAAELALAACATVLWSFLPDGPLRAGVFLLATSTWLLTLAINLSPFMRFDGYFLLSDLLGIPNLHERAFALGRWRLREWLFAWGDEPPESFTPHRQRLLIAFAYAVWIYRLVLFLGIAYLVYTLFFRALGIVLLFVELGWFIAYPIQREVNAWWQQRSRMRWNRAAVRSLCLLAATLTVLCVPWPRGVQAPAVLGARQAQWLYAPAPVRVQAVSVKHGQGVEPGQVMLTLDSPELRHQLGLAQARAQQLAWQVEQQAFDARLQEQGATLRQRRDAAREELAGVQALVAQLQLRAAFSGRVVSLDPSLLPGEWVPRGERLVQIASPRGVKVEAYVSEDALPRISLGSTARFIADEPGQPHIDCVVDSIDRIAIIELDQPALASPFGGPIAASVNKSGVVAPRDAHFRVRLNQCQGIAHTPRERIGSVVIGRAYRSFAGEWLRHLAAGVQRDAGL